MDGANGQIGGKNNNGTFVLTAFISFGMFNIFLAQV
jgi:succinate-acetate transporter protein